MAVVIDNGSSLMKVGMAGDSEPKFVFPTVVADAESDDSCVGEAALAKGGNLTWPMQHGLITDWKAMVKVWRHALQLLEAGDKFPVLLTEAVQTPYGNRQKMCQLMFDEFKVPAVFVALQPVLSLYTTGRKTGLVLEVGDGVAQCVPVFDGYAAMDVCPKSDLAGAKITEYIKDQMNVPDLQTARAIKESLCYLVADPETELKKDAAQLEASFTLPDKTEIKVGAVRVKAPELLFNPASGGLQKMLEDCVQQCAQDIRTKLYDNVVLSGGTTKFPGLADRMKALCPKVKLVKINTDHMVWIGGSILASLDQFKDMYLTKEVYDKDGPSAIENKFP